MKRQFASSLTALALLVAGAAQAAPVAIVNAKVHTLDGVGVLDKATIVFDQGKILAVGADVAVPADAKRIDAAGKEVTPGLANAYTGMGVEELSSIEQTVDSENKNTRLSAALSVAEAVNPDSTVIAVNRILGLTRAVVVPHSEHNIFLGTAASIHLGQGVEPVVNPASALFVDLTEPGVTAAGGSRSGALTLLRLGFADARHYAEHHDDFIPEHRDYSLSELDMQALLPVLDGRMPLVVQVNRAADIRQVLKLKAGMANLRLVIAGGAEAWRVAEELAKAQVPVLLDPMQNIPGSFDQLAIHLDGPARLAKAGVKLLFTADDTHKAFLVRQGAGIAAAHGLDREEALKAMTVHIGEVFGMPGYGALKAGNDADLVIWDGDPLEVTTEAEQVFVRGEAMPMVSRATRLRDRYKNLPLAGQGEAPAMPPAYTH
ncbi:MAG: amidohydrolase family protein [Gammaproteobacteria bacterium]|nr:amidohydrolase family protein [Gammaproteobacteria bacterium]